MPIGCAAPCQSHVIDCMVSQNLEATLRGPSAALKRSRTCSSSSGMAPPRSWYSRVSAAKFSGDRNNYRNRKPTTDRVIGSFSALQLCS